MLRHPQHHRNCWSSRNEHTNSHDCSSQPMGVAANNACAHSPSPAWHSACYYLPALSQLPKPAYVIESDRD